MTNDLILRLATLLDAAQPLLDRAAAAEKHHEAGKAMRSVTAQKRAESARQAVAEAFQLVGGRHD